MCEAPTISTLWAVSVWFYQGEITDFVKIRRWSGRTEDRMVMGDATGRLIRMKIFLVPARIELFFILAADPVLWFGFRMRIILITQWCLVVAQWGSPQFKNFPFPPALPGKSCTRDQEGPWPGQLTRTGQRDISYHGMLCSVNKLGGTSCCPGMGCASISGWWANVLYNYLSLVLFLSFFFFLILFFFFLYYNYYCS